jgi:hypothetical protein
MSLVVFNLAPREQLQLNSQQIQKLTASNQDFNAISSFFQIQMAKRFIRSEDRDFLKEGVKTY